MPAQKRARTSIVPQTFGILLAVCLTLFALALGALLLLTYQPWNNTTSVRAKSDYMRSSSSSSLVSSSSIEARLASLPVYTQLQSTDLKAITTSASYPGFSLIRDANKPTSLPTLSAASAKSLDDARAAFSLQDAQTSYVIMDLASGRGFAEGLDTLIYGASSFKGPYCVYLAETMVDTNKVALSDSIGSGLLDESGEVYEEVNFDTLRFLIRQTILYSDNSTYASLREAYSNDELAAWLEDMGVEKRVAYDTWFPFNTVRNLAMLWVHTYQYLQTNTPAAQELKALFEQTEVSFIRGNAEAAKNSDDMTVATSHPTLQTSALLDDLPSENAVSFGNAIDRIIAPRIIQALNAAGRTSVINKAGWSSDVETKRSALVDCGIVRSLGRDYLMCVMTSAPNTDDNIDAMTQLCQAVFNTRNDLA